MHDPMTVIGEFPADKMRERFPWLPHLVTLWHVDPEKDGSDDSCDWFNRGKAEDKADPRRLAVYEALWDMETLLDNRPHYPDSPEHKAFQPLKEAIRAALAPPPRPWYRHPRWHFWHWKIQCHPWQVLRRWLLTRCCRCGKRFPWGYAPCSSHWDSPPLRWFRGEEGLYHHDCRDPNDNGMRMVCQKEGSQ